MEDPLIEQYRRHPYPPIPRLALPLRLRGPEHRYEYGRSLSSIPGAGHRGIRILVLGCGTFEPLGVALEHPDASEIVAMDASESSLAVLRDRLRFYRVASTCLPWRRRLPRIALECADLWSWEPNAPFDLVIASNVIHHLSDPAAALGRLVTWIKPNGLLKLTTYPLHSRHWMRVAALRLRESGISASDPDLRAMCRKVVRTWDKSSPERVVFETHPEVGSEAGLIDAFFNARENPLSPAQWAQGARSVGLSLCGEAQDFGSRSDYLVELDEKTARLSAWERLEILDRWMELGHNPVLWLERLKPDPAPLLPAMTFDSPIESVRSTFWSLESVGASPKEIWRRIVSRELGSRVRCLTVARYSWEELGK